MAEGTKFPTTDINSFGADAHHRQRQRIVAAQYSQVGRSDDRGTLIQFAGRFLDHRDARNVGQSLDRFNVDLFASSPRNVVDTDRYVDLFGNRFEVLKETFLGRFVVVGGNLQSCVGTFGGGLALSVEALRQCYCCQYRP